MKTLLYWQFYRTLEHSLKDQRIRKGCVNMIKINNAKSLSIVTVVMLMLTIGVASAVPSISVEPSTNIVKPGDDFTVNIVVNPDGSSVHAGAFTLLFNTSMLQVNEIISPIMQGVSLQGHSLVRMEQKRLFSSTHR